MLGVRRLSPRVSPRTVIRLYSSQAAQISRATMTDSDPIEEEILPGYRPENYYPVHIGQLLNAQYKVLAKLGFGGGSTTWIAQDITKYLRSITSLSSSDILIGGDSRRTGLSPLKFSREMQSAVALHRLSLQSQKRSPKRIQNTKASDT